MGSTNKSALAALAALGLAEISAATPVVAQGNTPFVGPYVGAHTGYATDGASFASVPYTHGFNPGADTAAILARNDTFDFDAFLVGVHGGINLPIGTNFVGGLEADWTRLNDTSSTSGSRSGTALDGQAFQNRYRSELELEWQSTIRGRIGFVSGNTFFFATAGVAFLDLNWSDTSTVVRTLIGNPDTLSHSKSDTLTGSVVGGGVEIAISPKIIFGADYLYEDFGRFNSLPHGTQAGLTGTLSDLDVHKVRVRVSVKFGGPSP